MGIHDDQWAPIQRIADTLTADDFKDENIMIDLASHKKVEKERDMLVDALREIAKKRPQHVSRDEAADMACEFLNVAQRALAKYRGE